MPTIIKRKLLPGADASTAAPADQEPVPRLDLGTGFVMVAESTISVDIAKGGIDVFHLSTSKNKLSLPNNILRYFFKTSTACLVILEALGGYQKLRRAV